MRQTIFLVNGRAAPGLNDGETYQFDIGSAMPAAAPGSQSDQEAMRATPLRRRSAGDNKVVLYATGPRGSSAWVLLGDASVK